MLDFKRNFVEGHWIHSCHTYWRTDGAVKETAKFVCVIVYIRALIPDVTNPQIYPTSKLAPTHKRKNPSQLIVPAQRDRGPWFTFRGPHLSMGQYIYINDTGVLGMMAQKTGENAAATFRNVI